MGMWSSYIEVISLILCSCSKDLANFHRPKAVWYPHHNEVAAKEQGKLAVKGSMKVILKTLGGKGSKLYVDASETMEVLKVKAAKKLGGKTAFCTPFLQIERSTVGEGWLKSCGWMTSSI